jgi:hypothetical protein
MTTTYIPKTNIEALRLEVHELNGDLYYEDFTEEELEKMAAILRVVHRRAWSQKVVKLPTGWIIPEEER